MENNNINIYVEQREKRAPVADPNLKYLVEIMKMSTPTKPVAIVNPMDELRYKKLLTVNEAAQLFGVGINKIRSLTEDALTLAQQNLFEDYLWRNNKARRWYPIFVTMLWTGMRVGEITGLRWCDVDFEENTISVNHTLIYFSEGGRRGKAKFAINTTKTKAGDRIIPMLPKVREALLMEKKYQEDIDVQCEAVIDGYTDFIFVNRFGNTQHQGTLNKALYRIIRDCNYEVMDKHPDSENVVLLPNFSNHNLRHTFATRMCEAGVNLKAMQDVLGHADAETTMDIYAEATKDLKVSELKSFAEFFEDQKKAQITLLRA